MPNGILPDSTVHRYIRVPAMSAEDMGWVFRHSPYAATTRVIHLAIADSTNDAFDHVFWMCQEKLALKAACSRDTVRLACNQMVADGYLEELAPKKTDHGGKPVRRFRMLFPDAPVLYDSRQRTAGLVSNGKPVAGAPGPMPDLQVPNAESPGIAPVPNAESPGVAPGPMPNLQVPNAESPGINPIGTQERFPVDAYASTPRPKTGRGIRGTKLREGVVWDTLWRTACELDTAVFSDKEREKRAIHLESIHKAIAREYPHEADKDPAEFALFVANCLERRAERYREWWEDVNFSVESLDRNWSRFGPKAIRPGPPPVR